MSWATGALWRRVGLVYILMETFGLVVNELSLLIKLRRVPAVSRDVGIIAVSLD